jgi:CheY-like chemotaxis protein
MYDVLKDKKILSVEDCSDIQKYMECSLVKMNVNFFMCSNGDEAIELLNKNSFDLILMDLYMPQMNGIECITKIREELLLPTPIIALSGGMLEFHQEIIPHIQGSLIKPFKKTDLLNLIIKVLK